MKLLLIRHGRTAANEQRLYCGASDVHLSAGGRKDLLEMKMQACYPLSEGMLKITSGMYRTDETLRLLFDAQPDLRIAQLQEMNFGAFELHSYEELKTDPRYQAWICDETGRVPAYGGESSADFKVRIFEAIDAIRQDALVVCHGGVIAALMARWFPEAGKNMYQWQPGHGQGYEVDFQGDELHWRMIPFSKEKTDNESAECTN